MQEKSYLWVGLGGEGVLKVQGCVFYCQVGQGQGLYLVYGQDFCVLVLGECGVLEEGGVGNLIQAEKGCIQWVYLRVFRVVLLEITVYYVEIANLLYKYEVILVVY